jgi:hypothetical protein
VGENRVTEGEASTPGTRKISLTSLLWGSKWLLYLDVQIFPKIWGGLV